MKIQISSARTSTPPTPTAPRRLSTPNGTLFEILASPKEVGDPICLIRGNLPPGVSVPLHSHADLELFYVLEGSMEIFQVKEGAEGWTSVGAGAVITVRGNVKHALRNNSSRPVTIMLVTTSKMYEFFSEISKPMDANQRPASLTPDEMEAFLGTVAKYGYWMASPEENAAIGLRL
jgi:quercetin dioxygenase-like cupin family protein